MGVVIARKLQQFLLEHSSPHIRIYDSGTAGMEIMFQARGSKKLIIIDACATNSPPGTIFEVPSVELESLPEPSYNLHDFRWDNALAVGRKIFKDDFPKEVIVYLIEAENLDLGLELSASVQKSALQVLDNLKRQILEFL